MAVPSVVSAIPAMGTGGPMPGMVPVRLRTPSGKTALFYAPAMPGAAGPCVGGIAAPAADASVSAQMVGHAAPPAPAAVDAATPETSVPAAQDVDESRPATAEWAAMSSDVAHIPESSESPGQVSDQGSTSVAQGEKQANVSQAFFVGDVVYRNGELASVVHVDTSLHPPAFVVRLAQRGAEVSCEAEHLQLAFPRNVATSSSSGTTVPDSDELNHASPEVYETTFADVVQMQNAQQAQQAQVLSQAPESQQMQLQQFQMQQAQQLQQLYQMQMQAQSLWPEQGLAYAGEAQRQAMDQYQQVYQASGMAAESSYNNMYDMSQMQFMQGGSGMTSDPSYAEMVQGQHQDFSYSQFEQYAQPSNVASPGGNPALKAVAEALDRAEVNMLTGGRRRASPQPELGFGDEMANAAFPMHAPDDSRRPIASNFALQAAGDALGKQAAGDGLGTNFALQAAADALGALDRGGSSLAGRLGGGSSQVRHLGPMEDARCAEPTYQVARPPIPARGNRPRQVRSMSPAAEIVRADENVNLSIARNDNLPIATSQAPGVQIQNARHGITEIEQTPIRSMSPPAADPEVPLGTKQFTVSAGLTGGAATLPSDDDDDLELMAQRELEEDEIIDFTSLLPPPKPSKFEPARPSPPHSITQAPTSSCDSPASPSVPPIQPVVRTSTQTLPAPPIEAPMGVAPPRPPRGSAAALSSFAAAAASQPLRVPMPGHARPATKPKDRYMERNFLVDCVLNDLPPKRAGTPRGARDGRSTPRTSTTPTPRQNDGRSTPRNDGRSTPRGSNHRSTSRGPSIVAVPRGQSHDVEFGSMTPRCQKSHGSSKPPPHVFDCLHFDGAEGAKKNKRSGKINSFDDCSPLNSDVSSMSSLPPLTDKRPSQRKAKTMAPHAPRSARGSSWKESAVNLYA